MTLNSEFPPREKQHEYTVNYSNIFEHPFAIDHLETLMHMGFMNTGRKLANSIHGIIHSRLMEYALDKLFREVVFVQISIEILICEKPESFENTVEPSMVKYLNMWEKYWIRWTVETLYWQWDHSSKPEVATLDKGLTNFMNHKSDSDSLT